MSVNIQKLLNNKIHQLHANINKIINNYSIIINHIFRLKIESNRVKTNTFIGPIVHLLMTNLILSL